jgi:hypothetical protein
MINIYFDRKRLNRIAIITFRLFFFCQSKLQKQYSEAPCHKNFLSFIIDLLLRKKLMLMKRSVLINSEKAKIYYQLHYDYPYLKILKNSY